MEQMLFNENDFKETHRFFVKSGLHHEQNLTFKKQEMVVSITYSLLKAMDELQKKNRYFGAVRDHVDQATRLQDYNMVLDTFEDRLAHTVLLCYDYAGCWRLRKDTISRGHEAIFKAREQGFKQSAGDNVRSYEKEFEDNVQTTIQNPMAYALSIVKCITDVYYGSFAGSDIGGALAKLHLLAISLDVDLKWHINERLNYLKSL